MSLTKNDLPFKWDMVRNILNTYSIASVEDIEEGMVWYDKAFDVCLDLARAYYVPVDIVVGVMAIVSPGTVWENNISDPEKILNLYTQKVPVKEWTGFTTYSRNLHKAYRVLEGDLTAIKGNKVVSFYSNIMGNPDPVTVDRWAIRIALANPKLSKDKIVPSGSTVYNLIADAYRASSELIGMAPRELQAITWTTYRRLYNGVPAKAAREARKAITA